MCFSPLSLSFKDIWSLKSYLNIDLESQEVKTNLAYLFSKSIVP